MAGWYLMPHSYHLALHFWCLHTVKSVLVAVGEQPYLSLNCNWSKWPSSCCSAWHNFWHPPHLPWKNSCKQFQGCFVDLPIALDETYRSSTTVGKGSDLLGTLVPSNCNGTARECFIKDHRLVSSHPKTISKCFVVKCLASLLIDAWTPLGLGWVVKEVIGIQRLGCVSKGDNNCSASGSGCRNGCLKEGILSLKCLNESLEISHSGCWSCHGCC